MTFEKIHRLIEFLALFLTLLSGEKVMAHRRRSCERQYQRRVTISLTNVARSPTRKRTLKYLRALFSISSRVFWLALNSLRNITERHRCENSAAMRWQKNRTYHDEMRGDCWNITAVFLTFNRPVSLAIPRLLTRFLCVLWRNYVFRKALVVIAPTVSGRLSRVNRFYDYVLPRCKPTDAASWIGCTLMSIIKLNYEPVVPH